MDEEKEALLKKKFFDVWLSLEEQKRLLNFQEACFFLRNFCLFSRLVFSVVIISAFFQTIEKLPFHQFEFFILIA